MAGRNRGKNAPSGNAAQRVMPRAIDSPKKIAYNMTDCSVIYGAIMKSRHRTEKHEVRKRQILDAARTILIRRGYQDVRLDDISRSAGISKGALYLYFHDKEDLFAAVLGDLVERLEARLQGIPPQGSALDMLRKTAQEELAFVDENKDFIVHFSLEKPSLCGARAGKELRRRFAKHLLFLSERIKACIKQGSLRSPDPSLGAFFLISLVRMCMLRKLMGQSAKPLASCATDLMDLFLNGLGRKEAKAHEK